MGADAVMPDSLLREEHLKLPVDDHKPGGALGVATRTSSNKTCLMCHDYAAAHRP
jgi:hypothetical protein